MTTSFWLAIILIVFETVRGAPVSSNDVNNLEQLKNGGQLETIRQQLKLLQSQLEEIKKPENDDESLHGVFYDKPMKPQARVQQRQIGWQPLKRGSNGNNADSSNIVLKLREKESLKSQLISAIESHLLDDLATAQQYGVNPSQILEDLRQRNGNYASNSRP